MQRVSSASEEPCGRTSDLPRPVVREGLRSCRSAVMSLPRLYPMPILDLIGPAPRLLTQ